MVDPSEEDYEAARVLLCACGRTKSAYLPAHEQACSYSLHGGPVARALAAAREEGRREGLTWAHANASDYEGRGKITAELRARGGGNG